MSKKAPPDISQYHELEARIAEQSQRLEELQGNETLLREIAFQKKLRALMAEYGVSQNYVIKLFRPHSAVKKRALAKPLRCYRNPHTGEILETRGPGASKALKAWKNNYGYNTVESWVINFKEEIAAQAEQVFGSKSKADAWLKKPKASFDDRTPLQLAITVSGFTDVSNELLRISQGYFS
jgi:hypothetical protein